MHHTIRSGCVFIVAFVLATPVVAAQDPVLITTPEMSSLRELQRSRNALINAQREAVEAARMRTGAIQTVGPTSLFLEIEELAVGSPLKNTARLGIEHEFTARSLVSAERARMQSQLRVEQARLAGITWSHAVDLERHAIEANVWTRIAARLAEEDSLLVRASATLNARFAAGAARYLDVVRMRTERLRVQAEGARALAHAQSARLRMAGSVGLSADSLVSVTLASIRDLPMPELPDPDELVRRSPALALADAEMAAARAQLETTRAVSLRRWSAGIGLQRFDNDDGYTVGPLLLGSVSLPVPQRSVRSALAQAAERDTLAVAGARLGLARRLTADGRAAETRMVAARQQFEAIDLRLLGAARDERESALIGYAAGEMSLLDLLDFERTLARAEIQRLDSYLEMIDVWATLWQTAARAEHEEEK